MRSVKLRQKGIRQGILTELERPYAPSGVRSFPWTLVDRLVKDQNLRDPVLVKLLSEAITEQSALKYLSLQPYAEPQLYSSAAEYLSVTAVLSFLKKYPFGKVEGVDPLQSARKRSDTAEMLCRQANKRLKFYRRNEHRLYKKRLDVFQVFHLARRQVARILGPLDLSQVYDHCRHGPGGSLEVNGDETTAYFKFMLSPYTVSPRALPYAAVVVLNDPLWRRLVCNQNDLIGDRPPSIQEAREIVLSQFKVVDYNKVTYVPKTALTHRSIAVEPTMNVYLQLGVGDLMAKKLRHAGTNIYSQTRNQYLARAGSSWCGPSEACPVTLDMSMASDTMSIELVRELLPDEWFTLLYALRSFNGSESGRVTQWAKFSSMGNGFTFPLETLVFKVLAESVARHIGIDPKRVAVYGDDIVCPRGMSLLLKEVLAFAGFRLNTEKSYFFGPFRESCGEDWFEGAGVRPFFLKREIKSARDLLFVLNSLGGLNGLFDRYDLLPRNSGTPSIEISSEGCRTFCYNCLPKLVKQHLLGPQVEALEGHIHAPWDLAQESCFVLWDRDVQAWSYASVVDVPLVYSGRPGPLYLQLMDSRRQLDGGSDSTVSHVVCPFDYERSGLRVDLRRHLALVFTDVDGRTNVKVGVTMRNRTKSRVATHTHTGWR